MSVLVDTNILSRIAESDHPQNAAAAAAVKLLLTRGETLHGVPQIAYEFWVVATRPTKDNGLGMTTRQATMRLNELLQILVFLPDPPEIFGEWQRLVVEFDCKGKTAHDARLVAAMRVHHIGQIITFNTRDFARYPGITAISPEEMMARHPPK